MVPDAGFELREKNGPSCSGGSCGPCGERVEFWASPLAGDVLRDVGDAVPSPLVCSLSLSSPSGCELTGTSVIMDNTSHKAAREAVDLEVVDVDLADLVIICAHGLGRPRAS